MYNRKYKLTGLDSRRNTYVHTECLHKVCYLAYFNDGERGWFLCDVDDGTEHPVHRIHTSKVRSVKYLDGGNKVIVNTENTNYEFTDLAYLGALCKVIDDAPSHRIDYKAIKAGGGIELNGETETND